METLEAAPTATKTSRYFRRNENHITTLPQAARAISTLEFEQVPLATQNQPTEYMIMTSAQTPLPTHHKLRTPPIQTYPSEACIQHLLPLMHQVL